MTKSLQGFGGAKLRTGASSEHNFAEKDKVRYPSAPATLEARQKTGFLRGLD